MIISALNNQTQNASKTYLASDFTTLGTSIVVRNYNNFTGSWVAQVGETGEEKTEIAIINATPTNGTISLTSALRYSHPIDTPVYCYKYNQILFKRSTSGTSGTASVMTGGTVTITPDNFIGGTSYTIFEDTSGSSTYTYKTQLYNSVGAWTSGESDWIYTPGASSTEPYSLSKIRERIKHKMLNNVDDDTIDEWINEWHETMTNALIETNRDYAIGTTNIVFNAGVQYGTITDEDFKKPRRVQLIDGSGTTQVDPKALTDSIPTRNYYINGRDSYFFRGDNIIGRDPYQEAGTLSIEYYKLNPQLDSDGDTLPLPMRGYTRSYVKYGQAQAAYLDNKDTLAQRLENEANGLRSQFMIEMSPRQKDGPEYVKVQSVYEQIF